MPKTHIIITRWAGDHKQYLDFTGRATADDKLFEIIDDYPQAFIAVHPQGNFADWEVDVEAGTVTISKSKKDQRERDDALFELTVLETVAYAAEMRAFLNLDTGTTPEAKAYREAKGALGL